MNGRMNMVKNGIHRYGNILDMKDCPICIKMEEKEPESIEDDEKMCGYCFDVYETEMSFFTDP